MGAIRIDGFDNYQTSGGTLTAPGLAGTGYSLYSSGPGATITAQPGVGAGSLAFQCTRTGGAYANFIYNFSSDANVVVIGFALFGSVRAPVMRLNNALTIEWSANGPLALNGAEGEWTTVLRRWYYVELVIDKTAGTAALFVNDVAFVSIPLPSALADVTNWAALFGWMEAGTAGQVRFDDLVILDSADTGDGIAGRLGPVENVTRLPVAATVDEFDSSHPELTPVEVVTTMPPQEGRFLESATSGARELFEADEFDDLRPILAVTATGVMSKTDLDDRTMGLQFQQGEDVVEREFDVGLTFQYYQYSRALDALGDPWTPEALDDLEWGAVVRP